jgi:hypothetical protein
MDLVMIRKSSMRAEDPAQKQNARCIIDENVTGVKEFATGATWKDASSLKLGRIATIILVCQGACRLCTQEKNVFKFACSF